MTSNQQILLSFFTAFFTALGTALVTALVTYIGYFRKAKADLQNEYETRFNEKKWECYIKFYTIIKYINQMSELESLREAKSEEDEDELQGIAGKFYNLIDDIQAEILFIGSKKVVEKFEYWLHESSSFILYDETSFKNFIDLINAIREDLGEENAFLNYKQFDGYYYFKQKARK